MTVFCYIFNEVFSFLLYLYIEIINIPTNNNILSYQIIDNINTFSIFKIF